MSSNNQPPFKVICIDDKPRHYSDAPENMIIKKGSIYTVISQKPSYYIDGAMRYFLSEVNICDFIGRPIGYTSDRFRRLDELYQSDVTKELAEKALSVGDSVDQPVKKLVNN